MSEEAWMRRLREYHGFTDFTFVTFLTLLTILVRRGAVLAGDSRYAARE
jgi:hypothetical protein